MTDKSPEIKEKKPEKKQNPLDAINPLINKLLFNPAFFSDQEGKKAEKKLIEFYSSANDDLKTRILFIIHDRLAASATFRIMKATSLVGDKSVDMEKVRRDVYRFMFGNQFTYLGIIRILKLLAKFSDDRSLKLLLTHFNFYLSQQGPVFDILKNATADILLDIKHPLVVEALANYVQYSDKPIKNQDKILEYFNSLPKKLKTSKRYSKILEELLNSNSGKGEDYAHYG